MAEPLAVVSSVVSRLEICYQWLKTLAGSRAIIEEQTISTRKDWPRKQPRSKITSKDRDTIAQENWPRIQHQIYSIVSRVPPVVKHSTSSTETVSAYYVFENDTPTVEIICSSESYGRQLEKYIRHSGLLDLENVRLGVHLQSREALLEATTKGVGIRGDGRNASAHQDEPLDSSIPRVEMGSQS